MESGRALTGQEDNGAEDRCAQPRKRFRGRAELTCAPATEDLLSGRSNYRPQLLLQDKIGVLHEADVDRREDSQAYHAVGRDQHRQGQHG